MKKQTQMDSPSEEGRAIALLTRKLGKKIFLGEKIRFSASFDGSKLSFLPSAVIRPSSERDIEIVLELANKRKIPVT
ncbi:MAG: FAD-binding oxidoreductase, partial [Opitutaceae bacterium]|nr:FAD-binding oxidoreductase [Opitutaceae bacterium]